MPCSKRSRDRQPPPKLIHHSDRGGQYAGHDYRAVLRRAAMRQSMSRAANCYDNAFMESCFGTIKTELEMTEYENSRQARSEIASYLAYYNPERPPLLPGIPQPSSFRSPTDPLNLATRLSEICQAAQGRPPSRWAAAKIQRRETLQHTWTLRTTVPRVFKCFEMRSLHRLIPIAPQIDSTGVWSEMSQPSGKYMASSRQP